MKKWLRKCPKCGEKVYYSRIYERDRAEKRNTNCKSCVMGSEKTRKKLSKNNTRYWLGKKRSEEVREKMSESRKGKKWSKEVKKRMSESKLGEKNPAKRPEVRKKLRLSALKNRENRCGQCYPNHNPKACGIINDYNKKYGFNFQHAENGGEVCIDGYWPDGLDEERKTIIEVDEPRHYDKNGKLKEKDIQRQKYLEGLGYKFIRIKI